jgi:hypothetical protein
MTPSTRTPHVHQHATPRLASAGLLRAALLSVSALATSACGGSSPPPEAASGGEPATTLSEQIGAPRDTQFTAEIEAKRGHVRVIVQEESTCDVIPVESFIEDGKKRRVAGEPTRSQPCNVRPARNVVVSLEVDGNTFRLGEPSSGGEVEAQLNDEVLRSLHGDDLNETPVAKVMLRHPNGKSQQIGAVELVQLAQSERRLEELLAEFRKVLDRPQQKLS